MSQRHTEPSRKGRIVARRAAFWVLGFTVIAGTAVVPAHGGGRETSSTTRVVPDEPRVSERIAEAALSVNSPWSFVVAHGVAGTVGACFHCPSHER